MTFDESSVGDFLEHYGVKRRSGRYKYGSGERPFQGEADSFINLIKRVYDPKVSQEEAQKMIDSWVERDTKRTNKKLDKIEADANKRVKEILKERTKKEREKAIKRKKEEAEREKRRKEKEAKDAERKAIEEAKRKEKEAKDAERRQKDEEKREARKQKVIEKRRQAILRDPKELRRHQYEFSPEEIRDALQRFEWDKSMSQYSQAKIQAGRTYIENAAKIAESGIKLWNTVASTYNSFNKYGKDDNNAMPTIVPPKTDSGTSKDQVKKWFKEFQKEGS